MPRPLREQRTDVPYHLVIRGNNKAKIFLNKACYTRYMELLRGYKERFGYNLYCYCLMPNHIHLVLRASLLAPISKIMQCINTSYTVHINKRFNHSGHVLEGRYKSKIVEKDPYLLRLSNYVHLNPVRARLCNKPQDYKYSSAKYYVLDKPHDGLVETALVLGYFSKDLGDAIKKYKSFLQEDLICKEVDCSK